MNKTEFLSELRRSLSGLSEDDINGTVEYYSEMIDDRIEDGMSEEEAVAAVGSIDEISGKILSETPLTALVAEKIKPKRPLRGWEIALIILGFPVWFPILAALFAVFISIYVTMWSVVIALYSAVLGLAVYGLASVAAFVYVVCKGMGDTSIILSIGTMLASFGGAVLLFFGTNQVAKRTAVIGGKLLLGIKHMIVGKGKDNEEK
ncbi:MAG: DUF1700 domain-containing protein [Clostridia bacterium]|nr:DUF1700 domain-containing protein [Clostridia bacterium]